jgi:cation:H+ antiporter
LLTTLEFVMALVAILIGAAFFTNAVEILGSSLGLRQEAVGSVLAAVGTALPESMIAIVAILEPVVSGGDTEGGAEIGVGAILGARFMLATLALFVVGAALVFRRRRSQGATLSADSQTIGRDLLFFLIFFAVAAGMGVVPLPLLAKVAVAVVLVAGYAWYVRLTLVSLPRRPNPPPFAVAAQVLASLGVIVAGAHFFVDAVEHAAEGPGLPAGLIALVLAPLATELPEKFKSVFWARDRKDTLALGNIIGAIIFQSTIPVSFGILFTTWNLGALSLFAAALALASGAGLPRAPALREAQDRKPHDRRRFLPGVRRGGGAGHHLRPKGDDPTAHAAGPGRVPGARIVYHGPVLGRPRTASNGHA